VGRRPAWVAVGLVTALAVMTIWLLRARSGVNIATVLSLTVSVASLAVAMRGLVPDLPLSRVARQLAGRVAQERGAARRQALGMSGAARPADIAFRAPALAAEPELVRWRCDGGTESGTLRDVADYYRSLDRGRLVVLGEPGAGKTVLATQLVIDLIEALPDGELQPGTRPPVPVWLPLTSVDLGEAASLASTSAEELAARLDEQITAQVSVTYQVSRAAAGRLTRERWLLPVLDGLDEMDAAEPASGLAWPRAAAVMRALNAGTGSRPVVLVCRRAEYRLLARSAGAPGEDPVLQDARQIVLQPLEVPAICEYLTRRFPGDQPGRLAGRWEGVRAALQTGTGQGAGLTTLLSSPWQLFLAAAAYHDDASDPGELTRLPADDLAGHLLSHLIPAAAGRTARPGGGRYQPEDVQAWLGALARHLEQTSTDPKLRWSSTDLRLERLWPIGGQKEVQRLSALAISLVLCAVFTAFGLELARIVGRVSADTANDWAIAFLLGTGVIGFAVITISEIDSPLERLSIRLNSPASRRRLAGGLALGLVAGLQVGLMLGIGVKQWIGVAAGLTFVLTGALFGLSGSFKLAARPTAVMRQNLAFALAAGPGIGLAAGLTFGGAGFGLAAGLTAGLEIGSVFGLGFGLAAWIRYLIGCWLGHRQGKLPRRAGRFLDWAHQAGLLRMAGTAAQFRHRELQSWLISPDPDHSALTGQRER